MIRNKETMYMTLPVLSSQRRELTELLHFCETDSVDTIISKTFDNNDRTPR